MRAIPLRISIRKERSLRSFITLAISFTVTTILLCSTFFYYNKTSLLLRGNLEQSITGQLNQVNQNITEQVDTIDATIPLFLSNTMLLNALETSSFPFTIEQQQPLSTGKANVRYLFQHPSLRPQFYGCDLYRL